MSVCSSVWVPVLSVVSVGKQTKLRAASPRGPHEEPPEKFEIILTGYPVFDT